MYLLFLADHFRPGRLLKSGHNTSVKAGIEGRYHRGRSYGAESYKVAKQHHRRSAKDNAPTIRTCKCGPLASGFIVISSKHVPNLRAANLVIMNRQVHFRKAKISVAQVHQALGHKNSRSFYPGEFEWLSQVRPGHPSYRLPEWGNEPLDLEPPVPSRASAHQLVDDVLIMIFKMLNVVELIKIERTCRRWQMFVRWIIGGHKKIDFAEKGSLWGACVQASFSTSNLMIHKMLIVNGDTLESLNLHTVKFDTDRLGAAIKQTAQNLQHLSYIRKHYAIEGCAATHVVTKQRGHNEDCPFS